jgi:protein TonB
MESYSYGKLNDGVRYDEGVAFRYTKFESGVEYLGGMDAFRKIIEQNLKYPVQARRMGIEGQVFVRFNVNKDGSISELAIVKGISEDCDKEAMRVVQLLKQWYPARQRGLAVKTQFVMPVRFKLEM